MVDKSTIKELMEELGLIIQNEKSIELEIKKLRNSLKPGKERKKYIEGHCLTYCREHDLEVVKFKDVTVSFESKPRKKKKSVVTSRQTEYLENLFEGETEIAARIMKDLKDLSEEKINKSKMVIESDKKKRK